MGKAKVLIAGGGIGGLTAALAFAKFGHPVEVFEQAPEFTETGAGIQLSPNATRVLHDLGLEEELAQVGAVPDAVEIRHWRSGRVMAAWELGQATRRRFGFPYYHIYRADLIRMLVDATHSLAQLRLHTGVTVERVSGTSMHAALHTAGGVHRGDIVVGADGIRSRVRDSLFDVEPPRFSGQVAWRGLVPAMRLPKGMIRQVATVWWGPHRHFVHYPVCHGSLINCVCVVEKCGWEVESWSERGQHAELVCDFDGWHETVTRLIACLDRDACFKWALFERPPMRSWSLGRIVLLGDACHAILPFLAQGAALAIEDAAVLVRCVDVGNDIPASLRRYTALRRTRTARVQGWSRRNAAIYHATGIKAWMRDRLASLGGVRIMEKLHAYDALQVHHHGKRPGTAA